MKGWDAFLTTLLKGVGEVKTPGAAASATSALCLSLLVSICFGSFISEMVQEETSSGDIPSAV